MEVKSREGLAAAGEQEKPHASRNISKSFLGDVFPDVVTFEPPGQLT